MSRRYYSLKDLRDLLNIELRNESGTAARYTDEEMNTAIARATDTLAAYFWSEEYVESATFALNDYEYEYSFPVADVFAVEFIPSSNTSAPRSSVEWDAVTTDYTTTLYLMGNHVSGDTIRVWYERHPYPYPGDLTLLTTVDSDDTTFAVSSDTNVAEWPNVGYLKVDNEIVSFTTNRSANTLTVVRAALGSAAAAHTGTTAVLSFVNKVTKPVFFDGVRDLAIYYLNRMRVVDAPAGDIQGNVTIMREINENFPRWIRMHRMRSKKTSVRTVRRSRSMGTRTRG